MYKKLDLTKRVLKIYNPYQPINITALVKRRVLSPEIIDVRGNGGMPLLNIFLDLTLYKILHFRYR